MQGIGRAVEADIGGAGSRRQQLVEARRVAALVHHAALVHDPHEIRLEARHFSDQRIVREAAGCNMGGPRPQRASPAGEPAHWSEIALPNLIEERVALARHGDNPFVISRLKSGWMVICDVQPLPGVERKGQSFVAR